ncbi:hypothetical protein NFHSH190041_22150 [Shewanella sp. NFH-SH190041]|uniref:acyl-CoA thioesterase n=1 Tax=Shewanella sp. NFH-SH190041 TaxID=2950245 RepID=UPI0021C28E60|nr:hotdog domain-containing protein [Shewanella sp. NFH-SH190041]BDM64763.1 hypothetical protein NFHSH190041_22150 [Shewanella sp. NFH-SH190041]
MKFLSRRLVMPEDLNYARTLFGGRALAWIDEEAAIYVICQLGTKCIVTKHMAAISFENPASEGDVVEFGLTTKAVGRTSITVSCLLRNKFTGKTICAVDEMVFVRVNPDTGLPEPHGKTMADLETETEASLRKLNIGV